VAAVAGGREWADATMTGGSVAAPLAGPCTPTTLNSHARCDSSPYVGVSPPGTGGTAAKTSPSLTYLIQLPRVTSHISHVRTMNLASAPCVCVRERIEVHLQPRQLVTHLCHRTTSTNRLENAHLQFEALQITATFSAKNVCDSTREHKASWLWLQRTFVSHHAHPGSVCYIVGPHLRTWAHLH
jgi:hypothetical protein